MSEQTLTPSPVLDNGNATLACPECKEQGIDTVFETPQGLAAHRRRVHNVEGSSARQVARRESKEVLSCPECEAAGTPRTFSSPQGLAHHRTSTHGVAPSPKAVEQKERRQSEKTGTTLECPECKAAGITTTFSTTTALGTHRRIKHGVVGQSEGAIRARRKREEARGTSRSTQRTTRTTIAAGAPARRNSAALVPPNDLGPREFAAYRLGVLDMMFHAIEEGSIEAPAPMFLAMFKAEQQERQQQLAGSSS